ESVGARALVAQGIALIPALFLISYNNGPIGWLLLALSFASGAVAFVSGVWNCISSRSFGGAGLSAAALFIGFFSFLIGATLAFKVVTK
ncbi:hypothetical protein, partial [Arenimonas oryziterrae]|uniref:hypothetical protein n=1 Tax=Arenimonas oryziterrae TaxID=498055 RepID=UPI001B7FDE6B